MRSLVGVGMLAATMVVAGPAIAHDPGEHATSNADLPPASWDSFGKLPLPSLPGAAGDNPGLPAPAEDSPGSFQLIGHDPLLHRGMNAALAVHGDHVYVGSRSDGTHLNAGVLVVDVSNPRTPRVVHEIGPPNEGNLAESSREMRVVPEQDLLIVLNHGCSELIHRCSNAATLGLNAHTSNYRFYDISGDAEAHPRLVATYQPSRSQAQQPHEFFVWSDPQRPGRVLLYQSTPTRDSDARPNLLVTDVSGWRDGRFDEVATWKTVIGNPERDNRLHSLTVSTDGRRGYLAYLGGGFLVADLSDLADAVPDPQVRLVTPVANRVFWTDPGAHSAVKVPGRAFALVTDEVYGKLGALLPDHGCPWGWVRMVDVADEAAPRIAAEYRLPSNRPEACAELAPDRDQVGSFSSHNPTLTRNLALITWHGAGLQAVSLANPAAPTSAAQFVPEPLGAVQTEDPALTQGRDKVAMWSFPVIKGGLIYVIDIRNGLYILRYRGPFEREVRTTRFLDGNSNSGDALRFEPVAARRAR